jgi:hypothetical protein
MAVEITNEVAELALRTYVQGGGHPRDAMRKAIETALGQLADTGQPQAEVLVYGERMRRASFNAGVEAGRAEASLAELVTTEAEPTDYEVWRDALHLAAVATHGSPTWVSGNANQILADAAWFHNELILGPIGDRDVLDPAADA